MIRISLYDSDEGLVMKLEGCLTDHWVTEAHAAWRNLLKIHRSRRIRVDLRDICHVDLRGRELMRMMHVDGAQFAVSGCVMPEVVREISESPRVGQTTGGRN